MLSGWELGLVRGARQRVLQYLEWVLRVHSKGSTAVTASQNLRRGSLQGGGVDEQRVATADDFLVQLQELHNF